MIFIFLFYFPALKITFLHVYIYRERCIYFDKSEEAFWLVRYRERYEELIKQCQLMHSSIGTGSLAYVVGAKVMDMRAPSKDNGITEPQASAESTNDLDEENRCINNGTSLESHSENSSVRESPEGAAYDSSSFAAPPSNLNGGRECDGSQYVNESCFDFPALPVTDLFGKGEEGERDGDTHSGKFLRRKLRFKDDKMHNFQISNNDELIIESNLSRFSASNSVSNSEIEVDRGDVRDPVQHSNNIEKKKEIVNRMRISDVPDTEFIDAMLPQPEAVSTDKVSEWLWTLHRIGNSFSLLKSRIYILYLFNLSRSMIIFDFIVIFFII